MPNPRSPIDDPRSLLMCPPTYYRIAYEINPWMSLKRQADHTRAITQWNRLYHVLTRTLRVPVRLLPAAPGVPDLVFTANAGLANGRILIRSNFRFPQRQKEEPIIEAYFEKTGYRVITLDRRYGFEGEGDALWAGSTLVFGFRFRSDAGAHAELSRLLKARVLPVELADQRFYHLDTCFCPLNDKSVLWFPGAFDRYGRKVIQSLFEDPIPVTEADAKRFVCNAIVVGRSMVIHEEISPGLRQELTRRGFQLALVNLSEFLKAGGSAKCLALHLGPPTTH